MNKKAVVLVLFCIFFCSLTAESVSVGVPGFQPENSRFFFGLQYSQADGRTFFDPVFEDIVVDSEVFHYLATLHYGLSHRVSLFGKAGYSELAIYGRELYAHPERIGFGGGLNLLLFEDPVSGVSFIAGAQYYSFSPGTVGNRSFDWQQWDASLKMLIMNYVADPRALVEPFALTHATFYAGLRYSDASVGWKRGLESGTLKTEGDNVGYFAGIDLVFNDNYMMTIEGRFQDENAISAGIGFKF